MDIDTFRDATRALTDDDWPLADANEPDFATQAQEMKAIADQSDCALGSVHAVTRGGALFAASASGSQLSAYASTSS